MLHWSRTATPMVGMIVPPSASAALYPLALVRHFPSRMMCQCSCRSCQQPLHWRWLPESRSCVRSCGIGERQVRPRAVLRGLTPGYRTDSMCRASRRKDRDASLTPGTGLAHGRLRLHCRWRLAHHPTPAAHTHSAAPPTRALPLWTTRERARPILRPLRQAHHATRPRAQCGPGSLNPSQERGHLPGTDTSLHLEERGTACSWHTACLWSAKPPATSMNHQEKEHLRHVLCLLWHAVI